MYKCVSDEWDQGGRTLYNSVEDFLSMCDYVFSTRPDLVYVGLDLYDENKGECVLVDTRDLPVLGA